MSSSALSVRHYTIHFSKFPAINLRPKPFDKKKKIYLGFDPVAKHLEDFSTIISNRVKYDILGKDSGTSGKRLTQVPSEYDQEMSFVMFRSAANESSTVQMDDNQKNQEEQLQELVKERLDEIKLIAEKVIRHRVKH